MATDLPPLLALGGAERNQPLHLDIHVGEERIRAEVERLVALGAAEGKEWREVGGHWIAMTDPEGNEFDVQ